MNTYNTISYSTEPGSTYLVFLLHSFMMFVPFLFLTNYAVKRMHEEGIWLPAKLSPNKRLALTFGLAALIGMCIGSISAVLKLFGFGNGVNVAFMDMMRYALITSTLHNLCYIKSKKDGIMNKIYRTKIHFIVLTVIFVYAAIIYPSEEALAYTQIALVALALLACLLIK